MIQQLFQKNPHGRSPGIKCCLTFALAVLPMLLCAGCSEEVKPKAEPARAELQQIVEALNRLYKTSPPGKEWKISAITTQGNQVLVTVAIPPDQASQIMRQPADSQFRLVADQVCPKKDHAIWEKFPADSMISVLPSVSGQVFIEVGCGRR